MNVLMISMDRKIFELESDVRNRHIGYGKYVERLDIIVFSLAKQNLCKQDIASNVRIIPTNSRSRWGYMIDAIRIGKKIEDVDLVTTQNPSECGLVGLRIAHKRRMPLQVNIHTDIFSDEFKTHSFLDLLRFYMAKYVIRRTNCIRTVSNRVRRSVSDTLNIPTEEIEVVPIFVDIEKFRSATESFDIHKVYPQFDFIILMVGRLASEKNYVLALRVIKEVAHRGHNAGLVVVGDGKLRSDLEKLSKREGISDRVMFEGWQTENLMSYYKTSDLLLVTSAYEGYGMVIAEALASGLPVLSRNVGAAKELGAVIVDDGDMADKISEIIKGKKIKAVLQNYPYKDKYEYIKAIIDSWKHCKLTS